jgi:hypothetical protein
MTVMQYPFVCAFLLTETFFVHCVLSGGGGRRDPSAGAAGGAAEDGGGAALPRIRG